MAETLSNGTVVPVGSDLIHSSGVQAMRNLGASVDSQLGDRYTKAQADALLAGKAPATHTHDDRYYTETEMDTKLAAKSGAAHTHPTSAVTGLDAALAGKARKEPIDLGTEHLDTIIDDGPYVQVSSSTSSAALGYPVNAAGVAQAGFLNVVSRPGDYLVKHEYTTFNGGEQFWRTRYAGTWNPWARSSRASEVAALQAQIAALAYKSGRINITSLLDPAPVSGTLHIERRGGTVWLHMDALVLTATDIAERIYSNVIPVGYRITAPAELPTAPRLGTETTDVQTSIRTYNRVLAFYRVRGGAAVRGMVSWPTDDAIPIP